MVPTETVVVDLVPRQPAVLTVTPSSLDGIVEELAAYHASFAPCFHYRAQRQWSAVYLRGLLVADVPRKNIEAVALRLLGAGEAADRQVRALQHFVSEGAWDDAAVLQAHWRLTDQALGEDDGVLTVDGSDVPKQGTHSAGVARQYCGVLGKRANCQAGVFVGYASRRGYTLLDRRLYLPEVWFSPAYQERWQACAIPPETRFATKPTLAADLVEGILASGAVRARWLTCDEGFGNDPVFLDRIAGHGLWYLAEVSRSTRVWPLAAPDGQPAAAPRRWVPPQTSSRKGPAPTRERLAPESPAPQGVEAWAAQVPAAAWQRYRILEGSKGPLLADFAAVRVVAVRDRLPGPTVWLVIRRSLPEPGATPVYKYYLSNAPDDLPLIALVWASGMRWPIERCFTEGKDELGLDHYECRFWRGWHHHMTLVILAHHFLVRLQGRLNQRGGGRCAIQFPGPGTGDGWPGHHAAPAQPAGLPGPAPAPACTPEPHAGAPALAGGAPAAGVRPRRRPRPDRLPAAAQGGRLSLPSAPPLAPGPARPATQYASHHSTARAGASPLRAQPTRAQPHLPAGGW
jgi:SRSO17 transposase